MGDVMTVTASQASTSEKRLARPQPLGLFDGPAGLLLVGDEEGSAEFVAALARGDLSGVWPASAAVLASTLEDDVAGALALLSEGPLDAVNRLVLSPGEGSLEAARVAVRGDDRLSCVVEAAAYASRLADVPPEAARLDGEFAVLAHSVRAARALEFSDGRRAVKALEEALPEAVATGPVLHARVLAMLAEQGARSPGGMALAGERYGQAVELLEGTSFCQLRGSLLLERGVLLHQMADGDRHLLVEAVRCYQGALLSLDSRREPEQFALANMNIGIAILAMPMTQASDQVRLGVAVQSLRAALEVYQPETHGYEWSSSQMNLANALQYLPSTHREDNLREAVDLYEEVLRHRSRPADPAGYARVLANQANALAHLGALDDAEARYAAARELFADLGDADATGVIDRQLAEIEALR